MPQAVYQCMSNTASRRNKSQAGKGMAEALLPAIRGLKFRLLVGAEVLEFRSSGLLCKAPAQVSRSFLLVVFFHQEGTSL